MDCKYVQDVNGNLVLHPKTGEPLQNCSKSDYVVVMETIERITKQVLPTSNGTDSSTTSTSVSTAPKDCERCK
jgi:hypothetical protein